MRLLSIGTKFGGTWMDAAQNDPNWEIAGCVARTKESLSAAGKKYGIDDKFLFNDVATALDNTPELDAVVVAVPNNLHYQYAKMVIEKGYHLIIEKPITETWQEAIDLVKILDSKENLKACVGQTLRGDIMLRLMEYKLKSGVIGNIEQLTFQAYWNWVDDPAKSWRFRLPNMYLDDIGIHQFDTIRMMLGGLKPKKAFGMTFTPPSYPIQDIKATAHGLFVMEDDVPVNYFGSQATKGETIGWYGIIKVFGEKGSMIKTPYSEPYVVYEGNNEKIGMDDDDIDKYVDLEHEKIGYLLHDFYKAIKEDRPPVTDLHDNIHSFAMLQGIKRSVERSELIEIEKEFPIN